MERGVPGTMHRDVRAMGKSGDLTVRAEGGPGAGGVCACVSVAERGTGKAEGVQE